MKPFKLIVSTPNGNALEKEIIMLSVRGTEGSLAVMAGHIPFITTTKAGEVKVKTQTDEKIYKASEGVLTVTKENTTLLCTTFE
ncbi:MAG: hypothetical protein J6B45_01760 [Clostridia bacterium]|nr:hypothetical protein [Clostridia bacterium]